jgi:Domain of unknown function (DUF4037)
VRVLDDWLIERLGGDPRAGMRTIDWLSIPTQRLAEVTGGAVYADGRGELTAVRRRLASYPDDIWRYVLACQWRRIAQEEAFVGRCGEVGDELGSAVVAARIARDLMRLCLLLARRYPSYSKWLGTAVARHRTGGGRVVATVAATRWRDREATLCEAYELVAIRSNAVGLAPVLASTVRGFHERPYRVLAAHRFVEVLRAAINDAALRVAPPVGAVDQVVDNTEVTSHAGRFRGVAAGIEPNDR